ncbi:Nucleotidylyl transferase [Daldinia caldariorum]|uniref:Nucleotidylyl transferase n=1 Tax=Daldinia caldariorum TaxID=326644 RepID=UPI002007CE62|nr:Nucleotidylyl transferase [Daldinia caldariorum]KAI1471719.1 Nucleotidylyl transferase [Daldinia caldariorum]
MPSSDDSPSMARLPPNLVSVFTQALKSYQTSNATFRVLCSLTNSSLPSSASPSAAEPPTPHPPQAPIKSLLVLDSSFNPPTLAHRRMALSALADHGPSDSGGDGDNTRTPRVLLLLAINNADKAPKPASFPQRLAMMYIFAQDLLLRCAEPPPAQRRSAWCQGVDIAVTTEPYFHAKAGAIAASDFYHQHNQNQSQNVQDQGPEQVYLTGFDTLIRIFDPKYYYSPPPGSGAMASALDPFFARAKLRVTMRTDAEWGDAAAQRAYVKGLREGALGRVGGRTEWVDRIEMVEGSGNGRKEGEEKEEEEVVAVSSTKVREAVRRKDWEALGKLVSEDVAGWIRQEGLYAEEGV